MALKGGGGYQKKLSERGGGGHQQSLASRGN